MEDTMQTVLVSFSTAQSVKEFVERISPLKGQFDLLSGGYILDAKSLMGIFGLDLSKPIMLRIEKPAAETMKAIESYVVREE